MLAKREVYPGCPPSTGARVSRKRPRAAGALHVQKAKFEEDDLKRSRGSTRDVHLNPGRIEREHSKRRAPLPASISRCYDYQPGT
jgi:hypothetical protein